MKSTHLIFCFTHENIIWLKKSLLFMLEYNKTISKAQVILQVSAETDIKPIAVKKSSKHNLCARKLKVNGFFIQRTFFSKKEVLVEKKIMNLVMRLWSSLPDQESHKLVYQFDSVVYQFDSVTLQLNCNPFLSRYLYICKKKFNTLVYHRLLK